MSKQKKIIIFLILIFSGLFLFKFITAQDRQDQPANNFLKRAQKVVVKVMPLKRQDLNLILSYVGSLKAKDEVNVFSKVSGKLVQYSVNEGDSVEKGQTIALLDRDETGLKYELAKVTSPISGIVGRTLLDKGANVLPGTSPNLGTPLAMILNMEEMIVRFSAPEQGIVYLKKGLKAKVECDAYKQEIFEGEVSKVSEVVDTQTRTLPIEITIPNKEHRLKSGLFCRIKIIALQHKDALVIQQDALIQEQNENYSFVVEGSSAKKRKIILGIRDDRLIEVLDGLQEGQNVIVFGQQGLKDGTVVEVAGE